MCHAKDSGHDALGNEDKGVGVTRETTASFKSGSAETYLHLRKYSGGCKDPETTKEIIS